MKNKINWTIVSFIVGYHAILAVGLPLFFIFSSVSWPIIAAVLALWAITCISVTAGYHRLYAHGAYKAKRVVEAFFLFFGSMACQGSAIVWAHDHRLHHAHTDTEEDPYSVCKGLWYAHVLWMFRRNTPFQERIISDLRRNPLALNQHRYYLLWMIGSNVLVTALMGCLTGAWAASFLFVFTLRLFLSHHCTWFINSLAHYWGARSFSKEQSAVDNYLLSLLTFGEGYHNYHHTFARDYRNGIRWYHFDPTKWLIWTLSKCGLASALVRVQRSRVSTKMVIEQKEDLLEKLKNSVHTPLIAMVRTLSDEILALCQRLKELAQKEREEGARLRAEQRLLERQLAEVERLWQLLVRRVSRMRLAYS